MVPSNRENFGASGAGSVVGFSIIYQGVGLTEQFIG